MIVSELDDLFEIAEYQLDKSGRASVELVNGTLLVRIPYWFHSTAGTTSPKVMVSGEATVQQLAGLKTILVAILQATNAAIENQHGWTKYVEPVGP